MTSDKRLRVLPKNIPASPRAGLLLHPPQALDAPSYATNCRLPSLPPESPSRIANIGVRRSEYGSALLQSPARAGHAERMRQIFQQAGREHNAAQAGGGALYPQLPNVSRKTSPPPYHSTRPQQLAHCTSSGCPPNVWCLPPDVDVVLPWPDRSERNISRSAEQTSGSWSDDSGYFITASRGHAFNLVVSPDERIYDWLRNLSSSEIKSMEEPIKDSTNDHHRHHRPKQISTEHNETIGTDPLTYNRYENNLSSLSSQSKGQDQLFLSSSRNLVLKDMSVIHQPFNFSQVEEPLLEHDIEQPAPSSMPCVSPLQIEECHIKFRGAFEDEALKDASSELSPLSPNVCIERGPSRYHARRKSTHASSNASPCKKPSSLRVQAPQLKENVRQSAEGTSRFGSPLILDAKRLGTRL